MPRRRIIRRRRGRPGGRRGKSLTVRRTLNHVHRTARPDPRPSNNITVRPFSYKIPLTPLKYGTFQIEENFSLIFPDLNTAAITSLRVDRFTVWGPATDNGQPTQLEYDRFSKTDQSGRNHRAVISFAPKFLDRYPPLAFWNGALLHVEGVVYVRRAALTTTTTSTAPSVTLSPASSSLGTSTTNVLSCCSCSVPMVKEMASGQSVGQEEHRQIDSMDCVQANTNQEGTSGLTDLPL